MKIRTGFVSNSSSSSFVLITTVEHWEKIKATLHPYCIAVAEAIKSKPRKFLGHDIVLFETWSNHGMDWTEDIDPRYSGEPYLNLRGYEVCVHDAWDEALGELRKTPDQIIEYSVDLG